jgi:hypothetical protein
MKNTYDVIKNASFEQNHPAGSGGRRGTQRMTVVAL